jgi:hypothetical protein
MPVKPMNFVDLLVDKIVFRIPISIRITVKFSSIFFLFFSNQLWFAPLDYRSYHVAKTGSRLGGAETVRRLAPSSIGRIL